MAKSTPPTHTPSLSRPSLAAPKVSLTAQPSPAWAVGLRGGRGGLFARAARGLEARLGHPGDMHALVLVVMVVVVGTATCASTTDDRRIRLVPTPHPKQNKRNSAHRLGRACRAATSGARITYRAFLGSTTVARSFPGIVSPSIHWIPSFTRTDALGKPTEAIGGTDGERRPPPHSPAHL